MTVQDVAPAITYILTGITDYSFSFEIFTEENIAVVYLDDVGGAPVEWELSTDFTVTINPDRTGYISVVDTGAEGEIVISRTIPQTQEVAWVNNDPLDMVVQENSFDKLTMLIQDLDAAQISYPPGFPLSVEFPLPESEKVIGWSTDATTLENYPSYGSFQTLHDEAAASAAAAATSEANAATSETNAASSASDSASSASDSATSAAAASVSEANAAASEAAIAGAEANCAASETAAIAAQVAAEAAQSNAEDAEANAEISAQEAANCAADAASSSFANWEDSGTALQPKVSDNADAGSLTNLISNVCIANDPTDDTHAVRSSYLNDVIYDLGNYRNYLDNGDFFISERNSSFTVNATTSPTIDRWVVSSGDGVASISHAYAGLSQYPGLNFRPVFCMRFNQTTASTTGAGMFQHFPSVYYLAGQTVTVLWDVFNNSGSDIDCHFAIEQCFGSGGSATVGTVGTTETITTSGWNHFSQTIDIPDIYDKTVVWGSDYFRFHFLIDSTSIFDIYPSNFRLYLGSNIQRGEIVSNEEQRLRCLAYFCSGAERLVGVVYTPNGDCRFSPLFFPEKMAMIPVANVSATTCVAAGDTAGAYLVNTTVTPNILNTTTRRVEIRGISDYVQYQACGTIVYLGCDAFTWDADTGY